MELGTPQLEQDDHSYATAVQWNEMEQARQAREREAQRAVSRQASKRKQLKGAKLDLTALSVIDLLATYVLLLQLVPPGIPLQWAELVPDSNIVNDEWFATMMVAGLFPLAGIVGVWMHWRWALWLYFCFALVSIGFRLYLVYEVSHMHASCWDTDYRYYDDICISGNALLQWQHEDDFQRDANFDPLFVDMIVLTISIWLHVIIYRHTSRLALLYASYAKCQNSTREARQELRAVEASASSLEASSAVGGAAAPTSSTRWGARKMRWPGRRSERYRTDVAAREESVEPRGSAGVMFRSGS